MFIDIKKSTKPVNYIKAIEFLEKRLDEVHKKKSNEFFENIKNNIQYDLIYIDASHRANDVLNDGKSAWLKTKIGGIIFFDDYNWSFYKKNIKDNPVYGINEFLSLKKNKYKILSVSKQLIIKKISE